MRKAAANICIATSSRNDVRDGLKIAKNAARVRKARFSCESKTLE